MEIVLNLKIPRSMFENARKIIAEEMEAGTEMAVTDIIGEIKPRTPANFGLLRRAWGSEVFPFGQSESMGRVFNPLTYALPVETGSKPHWPPVAPIRLWVERKLRGAVSMFVQTQGPVQPGQRRRRARVTNEAALDRLTYLVRRKIATSGTPAHWMARDGWRAALPRVKGRYRVTLRRIAARLRHGD